MNKKLEKILPLVQKPARYTGGELNSVVKDKNSVDIRYAFCFPDSYEIGMSHLGIKILYSLVNARADAWCERVFAPWPDMEKQMRENGIPLFALESGDPLSAFDMIGFTVQYELCYTNILNMLDLAGLPLYAKDRTALTPLVVAGGPSVCNAEPFADFVDLCMPGEGEEVTNELIDLLKEHKKKGSTKADFLREAAKIEGIYVPSLYDVTYNADGTVQAVTAKDGAPATVKKRVIRDLDAVYYPENLIVPFIEVVHDRVTHEIFRGCIRGCRFCQAGFLYRPIREKSPETISRQCEQLIKTTGYDEVSLSSLSSSDYTQLEPLLDKLLEWTIPQKVNIALPSLRVDNFRKDLIEKLTSVRRSGLTFAPEAGTQRMRDVINKNVTEEEIMETSRKAFEGGWTAVKLYFMLGLPTETDEDVMEIAALARRVVDVFYNLPERPKGKSVSVNCSASTFVPKPFTPFQWEPQLSQEGIAARQELLKVSNKSKKVQISFHEMHVSFLEAVFARGDRRLSKVIETAWRNGCKFDGWDEHFKFEVWMQAFEECGLAPEFYANRTRSYTEVLPWDHMDYGVSKQFLIRESEKAKQAKTTPHCRQQCAGCGADKINGGECDARRQNLVF
ncbi:MAG: TIGR03960 family B12-binding radical SAM protein [Clostridia bacterium]|nr:TIGR03960 family B12-binding radical SAM protein [Clostridia bacterium]